MSTVSSGCDPSYHLPSSIASVHHLLSSGFAGARAGMCWLDSLAGCASHRRAPMDSKRIHAIEPGCTSCGPKGRRIQGRLVLLSALDSGYSQLAPVLYILFVSVYLHAINESRLQYFIP